MQRCTGFRRLSVELRERIVAIELVCHLTPFE
jgi:hypothetical protein